MQYIMRHFILCIIFLFSGGYNHLTFPLVQFSIYFALIHTQLPYRTIKLQNSQWYNQTHLFLFFSPWHIPPGIPYPPEIIRTVCSLGLLHRCQNAISLYNVHSLQLWTSLKWMRIGSLRKERKTLIKEIEDIKNK